MYRNVVLVAIFSSSIMRGSYVRPTVLQLMPSNDILKPTCLISLSLSSPSASGFCIFGLHGAVCIVCMFVCMYCVLLVTGTVVPGGLMFYCGCFFFLFHHGISELRQPITAKLCHVIGRFFYLIISVPKF